MNQKKELQFKRNDFNKMTLIFLKAIRGDQTQDFLSHQLESNFNIVNRWETEQRGFYWNDFISLSNLKKWNVVSALKKTTHFDFSPDLLSHEIMSRILTPSTKNILKSEFSNQKLSRLAAGKSKLMFSDFLLILERVFGRSERFLNHFLDENQQTLFKSFFSRKDGYCDLLAQDPFLYLLQMLFSLQVYKNLSTHSNAFLAKILQMPESQIMNGIKTLETAGLIKKEGNLFVIINDQHIDSGAKNKISSKKIAGHFRKKISSAVEGISDANTDVTSAYITYPTHPELEEKIFELCRKFYMDLRNTISENKNQNYENIRYVGIDLFYPLGSSILK